MYEKLSKKYQIHYYNIKNKANLRINALEISLNDYKLKYQKEINRLNMTICEYESALLNEETLVIENQ